MAIAKGIQAHKVFKLGKAAPKRDQRNLMFAAILAKPVKLPKEYDFDLQHPGIPTPMFANDELGDCVIAGRAHQTLRFEDIEQGAVLTITDAEVKTEYFKQTGGHDTGLVVLDSLKAWRARGWRAAKNRYKIQAFAEIVPKDHTAFKRAVYMDIGCGIGLSLPVSAQAQVQAGKPWDVVKGPGSQPGSWGGHYVHVCGYTKRGPTCVTWGRKQVMTWGFIDKYCDEAYAIIDAVNTAKKKRGLKAAAIAEFLDSLKKREKKRK